MDFGNIRARAAKAAYDLKTKAVNAGEAVKGAASSVGEYVGNTIAGRVFEFDGRSYKVIKQLGEGGFAYVYQCKDDNGSLFAVKVIQCSSKERLHQAKQEVKIHRMMPVHPNIVRMRSAAQCKEKNGHEIVMLLDHCSTSLLSVLQTSASEGIPLKESMIWDTFSQVCEALRAMHQLDPPVAHRDIKPENVLQGEDGFWKVCDFGSATTHHLTATTEEERHRVEDDVERNTTMQYRAPEQIDLYRRQRIDEKVDIWALGCLLFKLAYWEGPFESGEALGILNAKFYFPHGREMQYKPVLNETIKWLLVADPADRPSIEEVVQRVAEICNVKVTTKVPVTKKSTKKAKRKPSKSGAPPRARADTADNLFDLLGEERAAAAPNGHGTTNAGSAAANLFDFGDKSAPAGNAASGAAASSFDFDPFGSASTQPTPSTANSFDAFGGFQTAPTPSASFMFGGNSAASAVMPAATSTHANNDAFGGFQQPQQQQGAFGAPQMNTQATTNFGAFQSSPASAGAFGMQATAQNSSSFDAFGSFQTASTHSLPPPSSTALNTSSTSNVSSASANDVGKLLSMLDSKEAAKSDTNLLFMDSSGGNTGSAYDKKRPMNLLPKNSGKAYSAPKPSAGANAAALDFDTFMSGDSKKSANNFSLL